nr:TMV resistance protein N-like [Quercus suber]
MVLLTIEGASSSSSTHQWDYDVFLNFRGKDTRNNFTSHLYEALKNQDFKTFIDNNLPRGEEIPMELLRTIRSSMIWIVVFSKDYASSPWCLNELVEIYKCRSEDRMVIPIFYKVSPSEVREQDGEFGIALAKHEEKFKDKVQTWRETLAKVAELSGFPYKDGCNESEAELIQRVIKVISSTKINLVPLFVAKHPVGIDSRAEEIKLLLDMESNDVCMLGIWGLGGIDRREVENLLGEYNWFASGSKVIITTRDKRVLTSLGINHQIYKVKELSECEARELFIEYAFRTSKYGEDYSELVKQIIRYAKGLPLALQIIGSDLCGNIDEWERALQKYENIPHENIQEILKISYGIGKLIDKCLVTLELGHLSMHDLVQQMGREIVQQESKELEQRSRIWRYKDAHKLLTRNMESNKIRSIMLLSPKQTDHVPLKAKVFKRMKNLKFLVGNVRIGEAIHLPDELRFLEWREFPLSLSSKCCLPPELVVLKMSKSNIILENAFKQGFQNENLKMISLVCCEFITIPDLCCPNLEKLEIKYCKNLIEVDKSIGFHEKLKEWNIYGCPQLQILPSKLMLKSLESFELCCCRRLEKFPDIDQEMKGLKYLDLFRCGFRELPSSMLYLTGLNPLGLGVSKLTNFLVGANNFNNFSGPTGFLCLKHLDLSGSPRIEVELDSWMQPEYFPVLTNLNLSFTGIVTIPESISRFTTLVYLRIEDCKKLREIPLLPYSVRDVCATNCDQLDTESSIILLIHFRVILHFLAATATCFGPERPQIGNLYHLELPVTEIPEWLKFNHRQSVGNSVSFLVGPKFSNLFVCIAFPSKDLDNDTVSMCDVDFFINGERQFKVHNWWAKG